MPTICEDLLSVSSTDQKVPALPLPPRLSDGFDEPQVISDVLLAFPGDVMHLMPAHADIPREFRDQSGAATPWSQFVSHWFFTGDPFAVWDLHVRPDIDGDVAFRHLGAIIRSFQPRHEHKEAALAWLLSRWFRDITIKP